MIAIMLAATVLLADAAAAAPAAPTPPAVLSPVQVTAAPPAKQAKPNGDEMVCKRSNVVGSRMPQRVCLTADAWADRKARDRQDLEKSQGTHTSGYD